MLRQSSIIDSLLMATTESPLHVLRGNQTPFPPAIRLKEINFYSSNNLIFFQTLFPIMVANIEAIMLLMNWTGLSGQATYTYDFDVHPTFDIANGVIQSGSQTQIPQTSFVSNEPIEGSVGGFAPLAGINAARKRIAVVWTLWESSLLPLGLKVRITGTGSYAADIDMGIVQTTFPSGTPDGFVVLPVPAPVYRIYHGPISGDYWSIGITNSYTL